MSTNLRSRTAAIAMMSLLTVACGSSADSARPDPIGTGSFGDSFSYGHSCPLQRIDTQFIRCDNLTGNGVPAPAWSAELT